MAKNIDELEQDFIDNIQKDPCILCGYVGNRYRIRCKEKESELSYYEKCMKNIISRNIIYDNYNYDNCISLCWSCLHIKLYNTFKFTIVYIIYILHNLKLVYDPYILKFKNFIHNDYSLNNNPLIYKQYKNKIEKKQIKFVLNEEQFYKLTNNNKCHFCGIQYKYLKLYKIVNDLRYYNKISYNINNCIPSCELCYNMTKRFTYKSFIKKCSDIYEYTFM